MAVSIDRVYQKVLVLANKEQRGYITPQEFNLFAHHAQMEIFEQYFYDLNQFMRAPGNNTAYSDMVTNLEEKISMFERYDQLADITSGNGEVSINFFDKIYRLGMVRVRYDNGKHVEAEEIQLNELSKFADSPLGRWSKKRPVYTRYVGDYIANTGSRSLLRVYPNPSNDPTVDSVYLSYIQTPEKPKWAYEVVNKKAVYEDDSSRDFEIHDSEESELVYRILTFAGILMQRAQLTQVTAGLGAGQIQQEKQ